VSASQYPVRSLIHGCQGRAAAGILEMNAAPHDEFHLAAIVQILKSLAGRLFCPPTAPAFA
jgi:hypothetical protein